MACSYVEILLSQKNIRKEIGREIERESLFFFLVLFTKLYFLELLLVVGV